MNSYEQGKQDKARNLSHNPYRRLEFGLDREDRMQKEVDGSRWEAGWLGKEDPYPEG